MFMGSDTLSSIAALRLRFVLVVTRAPTTRRPERGFARTAVVIAVHLALLRQSQAVALSADEFV